MLNLRPKWMANWLAAICAHFTRLGKRFSPFWLANPCQHPGSLAINKAAQGATHDVLLFPPMDPRSQGVADLSSRRGLRHVGGHGQASSALQTATLAKSSEEIGRCVIARFQVAESMGLPRRFSTMGAAYCGSEIDRGTSPAARNHPTPRGCALCDHSLNGDRGIPGFTRPVAREGNSVASGIMAAS